jgi:hypothetical protein
MMDVPHVSWAKGDSRFHVACKASGENQFCVGTESISVSVGQLIQRHGRTEMWDSVGVYAEEDRDGTLVVRVMVFNPDWDGPLQIACIQSRPQDPGSLAAVGCNLDHITI